MIDYRYPDLTQHPPRSARVRLGGFAHLPRLLDKARAMIVGKNGLYGFGMERGMDRYFFEFSGIDPAMFLEAVKSHTSDGEMLAWVIEHLNPKRTASEIAQWSLWFESVGAGSASAHAWVADQMIVASSKREDILTYCEYLDFDDYIAFGGCD